MLISVRLDSKRIVKRNNLRAEVSVVFPSPQSLNYQQERVTDLDSLQVFKAGFH